MAKLGPHGPILSTADSGGSNMSTMRHHFPLVLLLTHWSCAWRDQGIVKQATTLLQLLYSIKYYSSMTSDLRTFFLFLTQPLFFLPAAYSKPTPHTSGHILCTYMYMYLQNCWFVEDDHADHLCQVLWESH